MTLYIWLGEKNKVYTTLYIPVGIHDTVHMNKAYVILYILVDIYGKCRTMNPSTKTSITSTGNIQRCSQKK